MKKVYLIHCWDGTTRDGWYPWVKKHLENNNIEVIMENMPNTGEPTIKAWVTKLDSLVDALNEDVYFIGHSIGCQTIMRYLETKETNNIGGILFVAPWLDLLPSALEDGADKIADEWLHTPINFDKIQKFTENINAIFSTDDYFVSIEQEQVFKKQLGANTLVVKNKGHISVEDGVNELPEILIEIGKMLHLELLDIVDVEGNKTGEILDKDLAHDRNLLHNEIGIFILNSRNEILLQKRSANKRFNPNKWGLCAGHVDAYEDLKIAALRELKEEIGVIANSNDLVLFDKVIKNRESNSHITYEYYLFLDKDEKDFIIQEEELSAVKWILFNDYKQMIIKNDESITFSNNTDSLRMLEKLEQVIANRG